MGRMDTIMDFSFTQRKGRWHGRVRTVEGWTPLWALGVEATATKFDQEPPKVQGACYVAATNLYNARQDAGTLFAAGKAKFKTVAEAMEAYVQHHDKYRTDRTVKNKAAHFVNFAGTLPLSRLNDTVAKSFIEDQIERGYSFDTVRLRVNPVSAMVSWLEGQGAWTRKNPFSGLLAKYKYRFKAAPEIRKRIEPDELEALRNEANEHTRVFIEVAYFTGLRVEEILSLNTKHIDRKQLTWTFTVTKGDIREFRRPIAIPEQLVVFLQNKNINGLILPVTRIDQGFRRCRRRAGLPEDIQPRTFRKDYANRMRDMGASSYIVDLHQGRNASDVAHEHYLDDAVEICRPYVNSMFGSTRIRRVK